MHGVGMDERDLEPEEPAPRRFVDQLRAFGGQLVDRGTDVVDLVRDVVHSGTALGEELADRRVVAERGEQLDPVEPIRSDAASTPCSGTVSRYSSRAPKSRS